MVLGFLFGWGRKIRKLRKKWDRCREKALKKEGLQRRELLKRLDDIENQLRILEEQEVGRAARARFCKEIEVNIAEVNELLKMDAEEFARTRSPPRQG